MMVNLIRKQSPARIIAFGFIFVIIAGSVLLSLPFSVRDGVDLKYTDALYTSTSAVCVTGLVVVDSYDTFTPVGQFILGALIQIGGLGVTTMGAGIILVMGKKVDIKGRTLLKEALNMDTAKGLVRLIHKIFIVTLIFEGAGAIAGFLVFIRDYPFFRALGISVFHSVAAFNNSGFDILGNNQNLINYSGNIALNIITCTLVFFGGIGFFVICELWEKRFKWKKFSMHTRIVISVSIVLIIAGALLLKITENISWMGAFFMSVSARTAGFATYSLGTFSKSGLLVIIILMIIGASPGSTGGGIKTSTFFVLIQGVKSAATNKSEKAFHYAVPKEAFRNASVIMILAMCVVTVGSYLMGIFEPDIDFIDILFEVASAFGTAGLSTGITQQIGIAGKLLSIVIMYIGRLGPLTIATLWHFSKGERINYPEGNITIG